jgi:phage protein U
MDEIRLFVEFWRGTGHQQRDNSMQMSAFLRQTWALASAAAPLMVLFVITQAKTSNSYVNRSGAQGLANPAYRLQVYASEAHPQLPATKDWTLEYRFTVPPLPSSPTWNYKTGTVYQ